MAKKITKTEAADKAEKLEDRVQEVMRIAGDERAAFLEAMAIIRRFQAGDPDAIQVAARAMPHLEAIEKRANEGAP